MQTLSTKLLAGQRTPFGIAGSVLLIQSADQGNNIAVRFLTGAAVNAEVDQVGTAFKAKPANGFTGVDMLATVDTNVTFIISDGDVDLHMSSLGVQITNTSGNPVPVSLVAEPGAPVPVTVQGSVNVTGATLTATDVGIVPAGVAIAEAGSTVVGIGGTAHVLAAAAGRKRAIFYNAGNGKIALGGAAGLTFATAAIILQPGDAWKETDAPQLDWYAISDAGSTVNIQTVN